MISRRVISGKSSTHDAINFQLNEMYNRYFPTGFPHSIQGLGSEGTEFLLIFDDGNFSEDSTFLLTDYLARTPRDVLSKNFRVDQRVFDSLSQREKYIFRGTMPGSLDQDRKKVIPSKQRFTHRMLQQKPLKFPGGEVRITDSTNFPISKTTAAAHVLINPHALREMHWVSPDQSHVHSHSQSQSRPQRPNC
jgi:oxalate decarboxylase family bicupin protein